MLFLFCFVFSAAGSGRMGFFFCPVRPTLVVVFFGVVVVVGSDRTAAARKAGGRIACYSGECRRRCSRVVVAHRVGNPSYKMPRYRRSSTYHSRAAARPPGSSPPPPPPPQYTKCARRGLSLNPTRGGGHDTTTRISEPYNRAAHAAGPFRNA